MTRFLAMVSFLSGFSFVVVLGAGLMWLWAPVFQPRSPHQVAEGMSESASATRSQASRPDVVVEIVPVAGRLGADEPALIASEAVASDTVIEAEVFLASLEPPEPDPNRQVPVLADAALEARPSPPVPVLVTPTKADPPPSPPVKAQVVLELSPGLSPAPAGHLAPDLASSTAAPIRSPRNAPVLPAPEASHSEDPRAISTAPADTPDSVLDLSEIGLAQPVEGTPEPAVAEAKPASPEAFRDFAVAEPVTSAPTIPETANTTVARAGPPLMPVRPRVVLPAPSHIAAAEPIAPFIRPRSRDEAQVTLRSEARAIARLVQSEAQRCNIEACAAYRSFRASDCTYQPVEGPRQLCTKEAETSQPVRTEAPQCNIEVCAAAYRSFRASDCTYQPVDGPRQLCTKEAETSQPVRTEAPQCNIEVCAAAYRSFRASDCTYQPFEGSRQLCTR